MTLGFSIDGAWSASATGVIDPATDAVFATVAAASAADVDRAVRAARCAFDQGPWPRMTGGERATRLRAVAQCIRARRDDLAAIEVRDNRKPMPEARWDIDDTAVCFEFYAGLAAGLDTAGTETITLGDGRFSSKAVREPVGVAGLIISWNHPMLMAAWKVAAALATFGRVVALRPFDTEEEAVALANDSRFGLATAVMSVDNERCDRSRRRCASVSPGSTARSRPSSRRHGAVPTSRASDASSAAGASRTISKPSR